MAQTNLPVQLTSFVGREREIADVKRLLMGSHLVTLTGAGGSGKTRLAIQIASGVTGSFADGVWLVDLAPLSVPALVPQLVSQALGLGPTTGPSSIETLVGFVRSRQLLLILDNCEHLSEACAQLTQELLSQASELRILATSRVALTIAGEAVYLVSGLEWPVFHGETVRDMDLQQFMDYDAVRLFADRACAISPSFALTSENALTTIEICRRLDGLPLALELASTRVNVLTVQDITKRLDDRFALLVSSQHRGLDPRHHTLRAAMDWSYALLTTDEQTLFRSLAVFPAGWTLDLAEDICAGEGIREGCALDLLSTLVGKSLVIADTTDRSQARYRLLETIREYALEKLNEAGETLRLRDRHLDLFVRRAEEAAFHLGGTDQQLWLNWLESEHDSLRAALAWSLEDSPGGRRIEGGLRLVRALVRFWEIRGYVQEGMGWVERLRTQAGEGISPVVRVNALVSASFLAMLLGDAQAAQTYGREAVSVAEGVRDIGNPALSFALTGLASGAHTAGDYETAFTIGERAVRLLRDSPGHETGPTIEEVPDGLTRREREVVFLIGQGMSNSEIAKELVLSIRTVETHVGNILSKLDLVSRAKIMRWAMAHGLTEHPT